jgi:hypothetical protein
MWPESQAVLIELMPEPNMAYLAMFVLASSKRVWFALSWGFALASPAFAFSPLSGWRHFWIMCGSPSHGGVD